VVQAQSLTPSAKARIARALNIAVIGCGYWGPNLVRNFFETDAATVSHVCDRDGSRLAAIGRRYPAVTLTSEYEAVLQDPGVDAVCIATNVASHYALAKAALLAGKHVWVEKPLALHSEEARELHDLARGRKLVLMVDHTFIYTAAVQRMRQSIQEGELGDLLYFDSVRVNLGLYQHDVNVIWDLGVHDMSITDYLLPYRPVAVSAHGARHIGAGTSESLAYVTLHFKENFIAHFHLNWLAPVKIRLTTICGSERMIVHDDTLPSEKLRIYDRGITIKNERRRGLDREQMQVEYRTGDMFAPKLDNVEALQVGARHFTDCILRGTQPITNGEAGGRVVAMLEAAQRSLANGGREEDIQW
jgi:predicted dehydrogenase